MRVGERIDAANREAVRRMTGSRPFLVDVLPLRDAVAGVTPRTVTHAGPPVTWERMCGAQRGAVAAAILFEGWAASADGAMALAEAGGVTLTPNHHLGGVGPMAGVASPSMPVFVVEDRAEGAGGRRVYAALEEPRMNFGAHDEAALALRRWWRDTLAPALGRAVRAAGAVDLTTVIARALHRGDELHNRPAAATGLLLVELAPALFATSAPEVARDAFAYVAADEIFFLSLAMAAAKAAADAAHGVPESMVVTAMARNGTDFGIRVSGLGGAWFTAPSPVVSGLFLSGFGEADAGRDMGDSAITETAGLGGMVLVGAPAIFEMVGATAARAFGFADEMAGITVARHPLFTVPILDFAGAPVGIDVRKVVETGLLPVIDTAIAHRDPGHPIIGAGLTRPPLACFTEALRAFAAAVGVRA